MEQLLNITTVPIRYELKVNNARLEYKNSTAELEISRNEGGMRIKSRPIQLRLDTYEARNSVVPTTKQSVRQAAEQGQAAAQTAAATFAMEGKQLANATPDSNVLDQIIQQRNQLPTGEFTMKFIPTCGPNVQWSDSELTIKYQMDKLNFDLKIANGNFEFIPGNIELLITQMPDVKIEYVGQPMYVPPSAADNFTFDAKA